MQHFGWHSASAVLEGATCEQWDSQPASKQATAASSCAEYAVIVSAGVDPKSIVCEYFRAGQCTKGFKCKFSHDLAVERKGGKIDLFTDTYDLLHQPMTCQLIHADYHCCLSIPCLMLPLQPYHTELGGCHHSSLYDCIQSAHTLHADRFPFCVHAELAGFVCMSALQCCSSKSWLSSRSRN